MRSAGCDTKAPCSELRQLWQNLNVHASTRTVNIRLNKAGFNAVGRFRRDCVQWVTDKLCCAISTGHARTVFCYDLLMGVLVTVVDIDWILFQDNVVVETDMVDSASIMVWGCFSHDNKLDLKVVRQSLTGQRYIDDILEPVVYPQFRARQAAHPIFQDANARPYRALVVRDSFKQIGNEKFQWPSKSLDMSG